MTLDYPDFLPAGTDVHQDDAPIKPAHAPPELNLKQRLLCSVIGLTPTLFRKYGDEGDVASQSNRAFAEVTLLLYFFGIFAIALHTVFGNAASINPLLLLLAGGMTLLFQRMDAFLHVRGLYHAGKMAVISGGAGLRRLSGEAAAWYAAVTARFGVGIATAVALGSIAGQTLFAPEINAQLAAASAEKNAAIIAEHTQTYDQGLKSDRESAKSAADEAASTKKGLALLRIQDVANVRDAARQSRRPPRPGAENARALTSSTLQAYESKNAAADQKAQDEAKAYAEKLQARGGAIRAMVESDPRYINVARGLLARLKAIRNIAREDSLVAAGIAVVDVIGIGLELWVLVLFVAQCPTRLATNLYCDHFKKTNAAARDLVLAINQGPSHTREAPDEPPPPNSPAPSAPAPLDVPLPAPKRGRGRPSKAALNSQTATFFNQANKGSDDHG